MKKIQLFCLVVAALIYQPGLILAQEQESFTIIIKEHKFDPSEVEIPANKKIKLIIENQDSTPEEFESYDLNREEEVDGDDKIEIYIGPLKAGSYEFFGEYHQKTAQGTIVAK